MSTSQKKYINIPRNRTGKKPAAPSRGKLNSVCRSKDYGKGGVLGAARKKVYVVEGDLDLLFTLNNTLEQAGYDVTLSHSAKRLMEGEVPPTDLFILDKSMQDGDGLDIY